MKCASLALGYLALAMGLADARAHATTEIEPPNRFDLRWVRQSGAESCVSGAALTRLLTQVVQPVTNPSESPLLLLEGQAAPAPAPLRFRIHITVRDESGELIGERELTTAEDHCTALTAPALLVLAMSVDPGAAREGLPENVAEELRLDLSEDVNVWPPPAPSPSPTTAAPQVVTASVVSRDAAPKRASASGGRAATVALEVGVAAAARVLPNPAPGLVLGVAAPLSRDYGLEFRAFGWWPNGVTLEPSPYLLDRKITFHAGGVSASACRRAVAWGDFRLDGCAGALLGVRWLASDALANKGNPYRAYFGPELGVSLRYQLGWSWSLSSSARAQLSLRDDRFVYVPHDGGKTELFAPGPLTAQAMLALGRAL